MDMGAGGAPWDPEPTIVLKRKFLSSLCTACTQCTMHHGPQHLTSLLKTLTPSSWNKLAHPFSSPFKPSACTKPYPVPYGRGSLNILVPWGGGGGGLGAGSVGCRNWDSREQGQEIPDTAGDKAPNNVAERKWENFHSIFQKKEIAAWRCFLTKVSSLAGHQRHVCWRVADGGWRVTDGALTVTRAGPGGGPKREEKCGSPP